MIRLKNVSKFYYSKGVIASGFSKVNLSFNIGEFVAITGESGSGKSTLLNVISGLDTYEEGEMFINGEETSHYTQNDFENYRRKYISNIFQNFNLIGSYTVQQNIELVLLLNGKKRKDIKKNVLELIEKVGLTKFKNTKASKLSGGQKQRVAIARALAKDTPIIIADEPTGNLDSKSAKEVLQLLYEISKEKLVIVVTHNYEQISNYATRKITMHDGKVLEDKRLKENTKKDYKLKFENKQINLINKIRLSFRNTFNILPKFLLLMAVYLFVIVALIAEYSSFKELEYTNETNGYNYFFIDTSDKRIVVKKNDGTSFNDEDLKKINTIDNIDYVVQNDLLLDSNISVTDDDNFWIYGALNSISIFNQKLDKGRMPVSDNEIIITGSKDDYYLGTMADELLESKLYLQNFYTDEIDKTTELKVVGIKYIESMVFNTKIYVSDKIIEKIKYQINQRYSNLTIKLNNINYNLESDSNEFKIIPNDMVQEGEAYISTDYNTYCDKENCINKPLNIKINNLYYNDELNLTITKNYNKKNIKQLLNIDDSEIFNGNIFISLNDYNKLFDKQTYQSSIFIKDVSLKDDTVKKLNDIGLKTMVVSDALIEDGSIQIIKILTLIVTLSLVVVLFFISYFVIRLILKSRNVYFTTIRILGASKKTTKQLLLMELNIICNIAYFSVIAYIVYASKNNINNDFITPILNYLKLGDYVLLYIILVLISSLISIKYSRNTFKSSAINTLKEEV